MSKGFERIEGVGTASVFKGDPRLPKNDIDGWFSGLLVTQEGTLVRPYLYGADAGLCARRNVLLEHNTWVPSEKSATASAYMAIGVALEDMLASALHRRGRLIVQSQRLVEMPEVKISGKIDLVIFDNEDKLALVEVKSCGKLPDKPKPTHLAQIQTYCAVSGVTRAWLTYISRNVELTYGEGLSIRSFLVDTSPEALQGRLTTALVSRDASKLHAVPPVPAHFRKHTECHFCEFRDLFCWALRPGSGGDAPTDPMPELDLAQYIDIQSKAEIVSKQLIEDSPYRYNKTLQQLLDGPLTEYLEEKLLELLEESKRELIK